ncbi:MAG: pyruvate dehydrogenase (acetyl-transferring) E1 component subunit alpha, partial [Arthrobacter sp.]
MSTDQTGHSGASTPESAGNPGAAGPEFLQLITPAGERISHPEFDFWVRDITDDQLCSLFEDMTVIRRIDVEATALQRQGELALWPPL